MKLSLLLAAAATFVPLFSAGTATAQPAPGPGETHVPYEMNVYDKTAGIQSPGAVLAAPGDMYRYTYVLDDDMHGNPDYQLVRALIGVHILDMDATAESGDTAPEWGMITLDGEAMTTVNGVTTDLVEIMADPEVENGNPPYIYDVTALLEDGELVLEVVNLNAEGGRDRSADYGEFNMLRAGLHLYYSEVAE